MANMDKLLPDGANWVTYRDRLKWALETKDWQEHLTLDTITQNYIDVGIVSVTAGTCTSQEDDWGHG